MLGKNYLLKINLIGLVLIGHIVMYFKIVNSLKYSYFEYQLSPYWLTILLLCIYIFLGEDFLFWKIVVLVNYVKNVFFLILYAITVNNSGIIIFKLPYIDPLLDSVVKAGTLMNIELLIIILFFLWCIYKNQKFEGKKIEIPKSDYEGNVWLLHFFIILLLITYAIPAKVDITNSLPSFLQTTYFFKIVLLLVYFESIEFFENKFINRSNFFIFTCILSVLLLFFSLENNRKNTIFLMLSVMFFLCAKFPEYKKIILVPSVTIGGVTFSVLTQSRFNTSIIEMFTNVDTFRSYFLPIDKIATGLEIKNFNYEANFYQLFIDIFRPFLGIGFFVKSFLAKINVSGDFYHERISYGGLGRTDQILPYTAQVGNYSWVLLIIFTCIILYVGNYYDQKIKFCLKNPKNLDARWTYVYVQIILILSQFQIINLTILVNKITFSTIIILMYFELSKKRASNHSFEIYASGNG